MFRFSDIKSDGSGVWVPPPHQTLGIPRSEMPQVKGDNVEQFLKWSEFKYRKVNSYEPKLLKATQREFNVEKVQGMMGNDKMSNTPIMVSADGYVVDGHHRWLAALNKGEKISIYKIDAPIKTILDKISAYPKVFSKSIHEMRDL